MLKRTQCNGSCEKKDNNFDDNDSAGEDNDFDILAWDGHKGCGNNYSDYDDLYDDDDTVLIAS